MSEQSREVFISYHTQSGADTVHKICAALEGAGISCWYAPRDVGSNYAHSIVEAIRGCRVFLLVLNEKANVSAHVLNEINCAFDRFKEHEDITLLPFRIDQCSLSDDIYYYLGRIHIMDGILPPELLRVQELVDRISRLLGKEAFRDVSLPGSSEGRQVTYRIVGSTVYPDSHFVGREAELAAIHEQLNGQENKLFLVGMGGIGKSEIVRMYLKRHAREYDVVLWLSFEDSLRRTLLSDVAFPIQGLSRADFPEDSDGDYFQRKLRILKEIADKRVLLAVDNFDVPDDPDLEAFTGGDYAVIFTTRCHQESGRLPELEVQPVTEREDLLAMFRAEYTRALSDKDMVWIDQILEQLNGHPLSIRLVASAMQSRRISPEKMDALLRDGAAEMARQNAKAADLIFGRLRQVFQLSTLSEEEQYLLKNLSLVSLGGICVETLFDWCGLDDFDLVDDLIRRSWVIHDPVTDQVHLHPLVADLMVEELKQDPMCCEKLLHSLADACHIFIGTSYEHKLWLLEMSRTACGRLPENHPLRWLVLKGQARATMDISLYRDAITLYQELLGYTDSLSSEAEIRNYLSHCYQLNGDPASCRQAALEAISLIPTPVPEELIITHSELLSRLVESNRDLGNYDEAVRFGRQNLENSRNRPKDLPPLNQGWIRYHLARALYMRGDLEESEMLLQEAIDIFESVDDHYSQSFSYDILSQIRMKQQRFEEALELSQKSWNILLPQIGPEHIDMGINLMWRSNIYYAMGDEKKARGCYAQAADIYFKRGCITRAKKLRKLAEETTLNAPSP